MWKELRPAVVLAIVLALITGLIYPLAMTEIAALAFPSQPAGSLIERNGTVLAPGLSGQTFARDEYFHCRPSATHTPDSNDPAKTVEAPYNAASSSGSNLGPTNAALIDRVKGEVSKLKEQNRSDPVPIDLVTTSGSGLDPHI